MKWGLLGCITCIYLRYQMCTSSHSSQNKFVREIRYYLLRFIRVIANLEGGYCNDDRLSNSIHDNVRSKVWLHFGLFFGVYGNGAEVIIMTEPDTVPVNVFYSLLAERPEWLVIKNCAPFTFESFHCILVLHVYLKIYLVWIFTSHEVTCLLKQHDKHRMTSGWSPNMQIWQSSPEYKVLGSTIV